jgi:hypothetical protein
LTNLVVLFQRCCWQLRVKSAAACSSGTGEDLVQFTDCVESGVSGAHRPEGKMSVVESDVPSESALGKDLMERADFRDAYRAPLRNPNLTVVEIFFGIFAHRPAWINLMLIARNKVAALAGLETPTTAEVMNTGMRDRYRVGEKIGPWPISFLGSDELVAGRDNKHMDFRLSIMKVRDGNRSNVIVSTVCMVHNKPGQLYLSSIIPFHKFGMRKLMVNALAAGRL